MLSRTATYRLGGLAGIACALLFAIGWALWRLPSLPDLNSAQDVTRWFVERKTQCRFAAIFGTFSIGALIVFESVLYTLFRRVEGENTTLSNIFFSGGLITVAFDMVFLYNLYVVAWRPGQVSPDVTQSLDDLYLAPGVACFACTMAGLFAAAYIIIKSKVLAVWTGLAAAFIGITQPLFIGTGFVHGGIFDIADGVLGVYIPLGLPVVWYLAVGVVLLRDASTIEVPVAARPVPVSV